MLEPMTAQSHPEVVWSGTSGNPAELRDAGVDPAISDVESLLPGPVLVTLSGDGPGMLAAASVYAWLGVAAFRTKGDPAELRQVLDMVASIKGDRPPAVGRRALA